MERNRGFVWVRHVLGAVLAVMLVFAPGCAVLTSPGRTAVPVRSIPVGAEVRIDGMLVGHTPLTAEVAARKSHHVEVRFEGKSKAWFLEPQLGEAGAGWGAAGDALLLVVGSAAGGLIIAWSSRCPAGWSCSPSPAAGVALIVGGAVPITVDALTGRLWAVPATPLEADLR